MKIVFFDGYCTVCNSLVDWGLKHDRTGKIQFASLQGETAKRLVDKNFLENVDTVIYLREGIAYQRSSAILYFLKDTQSWLSFMIVFLIVPPFIRDFIYGLFAKSRYVLFQKRDTCRVPTPAEKERLLS
jgi:predicted DCC family thiol-disulfide oxidoreductase YuxK